MSVVYGFSSIEDVRELVEILTDLSDLSEELLDEVANGKPNAKQLELYERVDKARNWSKAFANFVKNYNVIEC